MVKSDKNAKKIFGGGRYLPVFTADLRLAKFGSYFGAP